MDITELVREMGISKGELSERIGVLPQNLSKLLQNPTERSLRRIAKAIGCEPWELWVTHDEALKRIGTSVHRCPHCGLPIEIRLSRKIRLEPIDEVGEE